MYRIIAKTNGWIASRDIHFNGREQYTVSGGLTLKQAQSKLIDMFNEDYETSYFNWGLIRTHKPYNTFSNPDGIRGYDYDSRYYRIEEEFDEE